MRLNKNWKCPECEGNSRYKGLCRECSTYTDDGTLITGVVRVRVDSEGNEWKSTPVKREAYDVTMMKRQYLESRRRKLNRSEIKLSQQDSKELEDTQEELLDSCEDDILEIGESINTPSGEEE